MAVSTQKALPRRCCWILSKDSLQSQRIPINLTHPGKAPPPPLPQLRPERPTFLVRAYICDGARRWVSRLGVFHFPLNDKSEANMPKWHHGLDPTSITWFCRGHEWQSDRPKSASEPHCARGPPTEQGRQGRSQTKLLPLSSICLLSHLWPHPRAKTSLWG